MVELQQFSENLLQFYIEMEQAFGAFQSSTGITCPPNCGQCCTHPEIEASPLEMLPLALHLYAEGKALAYLERLDEASSTCLLYQGDEKRGKCVAYAYRPSVCRMFGVGGIQDKKGEVSFSVCKHLKEDKPIQMKSLNNELTDIPMMLDWTHKLMALDHKLVSEKLPINQALKRSLEKILLLSQYE